MAKSPLQDWGGLLDLGHQIIVPFTFNLEMSDRSFQERLNQVVIDVGIKSRLPERVDSGAGRTPGNGPGFKPGLRRISERAGRPDIVTMTTDKVRARVAVEKASTLGWDRYVGPEGCIIGMETFGASAPLKELQRRFGFTPERIVDVAKQLVGR